MSSDNDLTRNFLDDSDLGRIRAATLETIEEEDEDEASDIDHHEPDKKWDGEGNNGGNGGDNATHLNAGIGNGGNGGNITVIKDPNVEYFNFDYSNLGGSPGPNYSAIRGRDGSYREEKRTVNL